ncbi:DUF6417 family protein [Streptomyces sp. NBC_00882]|uniref:DUF6417 family protein n=1 Tax=Streptomyces sp. NBC_00882 TaxID=2975856 RepID=UPI00386E6C64|nr:DUF6417 family protein [Streptomyces sp. NBC_00882]WSZ36910.1 DUF6417 family protein [Streptomyces sp. NBC_00882]
MDDYAAIDDMDFAPLPDTVERLPVLSLDEAHELLDLLRVVAQEDGLLSARADRLVREISARVPSQG